MPWAEMPPVSLALQGSRVPGPHFSWQFSFVVSNSKLFCKRRNFRRCRWGRCDLMKGDPGRPAGTLTTGHAPLMGPFVYLLCIVLVWALA